MAFLTGLVGGLGAGASESLKLRRERESREELARQAQESEDIRFKKQLDAGLMSQKLNTYMTLVREGKVNAANKMWQNLRESDPRFGDMELDTTVVSIPGTDIVTRWGKDARTNKIAMESYNRRTGKPIAKVVTDMMPIGFTTDVQYQRKLRHNLDTDKQQAKTQLIVDFPEAVKKNKMMLQAGEKIAVISHLKSLMSEGPDNFKNARPFIVRSLLRLAGDDRISEADIAQVVSNESLRARISQAFKSMDEGTWTQFNYDEYKKIIEALGTTAKNQVLTILSGEASTAVSTVKSLYPNNNEYAEEIKNGLVGTFPGLLRSLSGDEKFARDYVSQAYSQFKLPGPVSVSEPSTMPEDNGREDRLLNILGRLTKVPGS